MVDGGARGIEHKLYYKYFFSRKFLLHWGGLADSFCHYERKYGVSYEILCGLLERNYPVMFSSKGPTVGDDKYLSLLEKYKEQDSIVFQFSMVTADNKMAKKIEIGVPSPDERLANMKILSDMGYNCILRLRPFIIGVTDESLAELLTKAYKAGAKAVSTEFYAIDLRCAGNMKEATERLGKLMGINNIFSYFKKLSPTERGGYLRLNRLVKESYVKYIYKFCLEHDMLFTCSDPDFKELSGSGNCCGLSEKHPNKLLRNWNKHQLTHHIKEARKLYHTTGEKKLLHFNEVYKPTDWIFDEQQLSHVDINCTAHVYAIRKRLTLRHLLQQRWNNLKAPPNPRNYFAGKLMPIGVDDTDNFIYQYTPSEYEKRWVDEGIDLSK
jgi:DNA repair photolyase